ncbi:MAG: 30S ribosomal protein S19e [Promethearchaeota archaeon]|nr:MAG: 30S ribosomal protein S19e [Candidatus Lokiarchaeota archaeon]
MSIYLVQPNKFIPAVAEKLKEFPSIKPPEGSKYWKTARFKELAPLDSENFWYIRCASLLRKLRKFGPIGVNRLCKHYGGRERKKKGKNKSAKASGKIIRVALQQLEDANLVYHVEREGRRCTPEGISLLERTAYEIIRNKK